MKKQYFILISDRQYFCRILSEFVNYNRLTDIMISSKHKQPITTTNTQQNIYTHATFFSQKIQKTHQANDRKFISPQIKTSKPEEKQVKQITQRQSEQIQRSESKRQNHFLRKTIMQLYNFFETKKQNWDLQQLSYSQILVLLKQLKFIKFKEQTQKSQNNQELRKCYSLWLNLSQGGKVKLTNIIILLMHIQKIDCDCELIQEVVSQLQKGIQKFGPSKNTSNPFPTFLFMCKKEGWNFQNGLLKLTDKQILHVQKYFSSFLYTRLTQNEVRINLQNHQQNQNHNFMSKKSVQLADSKRKKILEQIKLREPTMESIELYHILNFKEKLCNDKEKPLETLVYQPLNIAERTKQNNRKKQKVKTNPTSQRENDQIRHNKSKNKENIPSQQRILGRKQNNFNPRQNFKKQNNKEHLTKVTQQKQNQLRQIKTPLEEELHQEPIPRQSQGNPFQNEFFEFKQDSIAQLLAPQSSHFIPDQNKNKQQKRREYIDLPILYVDVNIQQGKKQRIIVYEGDKAQQLAIEFGKTHNLNEQTVERLQVMLQQQIGSVLCKIDQAFEQDCSYLY